MKIKILIGSLMLLIAAMVARAEDSSSGPGGTFVSQFLDEGTALTRRSKVNWTGSGVSCVDNSTDKRLDCTISAVSGGTVGSTSLVVRYNSVLISSPTSTLNFLPPLVVSLQGSTSAQIGLTPISLSTGVVGSVDISTQTNLQATSPLVLTNDTLSLGRVSLSTGVVGPLDISSGTITFVNVAAIRFSADGSSQTTAAAAASGDITAVNAGAGLTGGGLVGSVTLSVDPASTMTIMNRSTLQTGATAYPELLLTGTSGAQIGGNLNVTGVITASNTVITTTAGLLDSSKLTGTISSSLIDVSSITKRGNVFNGASQLLLLDGSADVPDANLSSNVSLLGPSIDISAETNLAAASPMILTGDTISIDTASFVASIGAAPGGSSTNIQVNTAGAFAGSNDLTYASGVMRLRQVSAGGFGSQTSTITFSASNNLYSGSNKISLVTDSSSPEFFFSATSVEGSTTTSIGVTPAGTGTIFRIVNSSLVSGQLLCDAQGYSIIHSSGAHSVQSASTIGAVLGLGKMDNQTGSILKIYDDNDSFSPPVYLFDVDHTSTTINNDLHIKSKTITQLRTDLPASAGIMYYCSDCSTDGIVISTGISKGAVARISARTTSIQ